MFYNLIQGALSLIGKLGYMGIFLLMTLESSFFPFPSEVVIPPAGYLAFQGKMNLYLVVLFGTLGSLTGAWFNYFIALKLGRPFLLKYGKRFFISGKSLEKAEIFFAKYGGISTFIGRLVPLVRQYISLPAGIARMNPLSFTIFTTLGASIWVSMLAIMGYYLGDNEELIRKYSNEVGIVFALLLGGYILWKLLRRRA
ncbi:MAG: DedA family protein [Synergistetes bacterium]|nr:DedA family protein [Synergistota bacterium]